MIIKGRVIQYLRDNINTDEIIPARYLSTSNPDELAGHCMEDLDPHFLEKEPKGSILVAASNFGCGSSREHAPIAIKASGVMAILAKSYARIFFRNAIDIGLPIFECKDVQRISPGDELEIDVDAGVVYNKTKVEQYPTGMMPAFLQELISAGGLVPWARQRIQNPP
jgi:3-isopropylmalate/(R)-2-methylmalate dehydratase small subunit